MDLDMRDVTPDFYQQLDDDYQDFNRHVLISAHRFDENWPTWEQHPRGDEMVVLMSGRATFRLRSPQGDHQVELESPGEYVVVPRGAWHTALIDQPTTMLFITPGEGTLNFETPPL